MSNLDFKQAVKEITQAVDYLKETGSAKVGVIGFCMGGALSLAAAQHSGVASAAPFYGIPSPEICDPTQINIPVEGHFGEDDAMTGFSDKASALALEGQLKKSRNPDAVSVAEGAGKWVCWAIKAQPAEGWVRKGKAGVDMATGMSRRQWMSSVREATCERDAQRSGLEWHCYRRATARPVLRLCLPSGAPTLGSPPLGRIA